MTAEVSTAEKLDALDADPFDIEYLDPICLVDCPCPRCHVRRRMEHELEAKRLRVERFHKLRRMSLREQPGWERCLRRDAEIARLAWEKGEPPPFEYDTRL